ncbi:MAG: hypothetical protein JRF35_05105 [Deltaproteobacteria bacterium]|nr:hypothetical protein [Deltaproteobacteria bacterium]
MVSLRIRHEQLIRLDLTSAELSRNLTSWIAALSAAPTSICKSITHANPESVIIVEIVENVRSIIIVEIVEIVRSVIIVGSVGSDELAIKLLS